MGAKFDRDLTSMTTHLVAAFKNTPKDRFRKKTIFY